MSVERMTTDPMILQQGQGQQGQQYVDPPPYFSSKSFSIFMYIILRFLKSENR